MKEKKRDGGRGRWGCREGEVEAKAGGDQRGRSRDEREEREKWG